MVFHFLFPVREFPCHRHPWKAHVGPKAARIRVQRYCARSHSTE
jgi:hypothetical protein